MSRNDDTSSNKAIWIGSLCALFIAAAIGVAVWLNKKTGPSPEAGPGAPGNVIAQKGLEKVRQPMPKPPPENAAISETPDTQTAPSAVVDYDKLKKDETLRALMDKRKEKYGFEKGVDLIVKPDESVKVGDEVIPMNEILNRIRLQEGEVLEKDIGKSPGGEGTGDKGQNMAAELDTVEKRYEQLDALIRDADPAQNKATKETYIKEREELGKIVTVYEDYKETVKKIEEKKKLLASLTEKESAAAGPEPAGASTPLTSKPAGASTPLTPEPARETAALSPKPAERSAAAAPKPAEEAARPTPETIPEKTIPEKPIPAVDAGTGQHPAAPLPGEKPDTASDRRPAPSMSPEKEKPAAITETPAGDKPKKEIAGQPINPVSPAPQRAAPAPTAPPGPSVREGRKMVTIESLKKEIQEELNTLLLQKGDLENELLMLLKKEKRPEAYGIYVVQRKDNIWNIHYKFLKEYFGHRNVDLSQDADEPDRRGRSSGIGKVLKFSEKMVYIYNIRERRLASDIHLIHPLSKIVVFNMAKVFDLLEDVDYRDMDQIQFDGENIWLPAKS